jgi:TonB family protein
VRTSVLIAISVFAVALSAQDLSSPAQFQTGALPTLPPLTVGGGQVLLEVSVGTDGRVTEVRPLRTTPPFTETLTQAVRDWRFRPAEDVDTAAPGADRRTAARTPVASKVLVVGVFRPPALNMPTLGESPKEGAPASDDTAFPLTITPPTFPPQALRGGVVLLEARIDRGGQATDIKTLRSSAPFDDAARRAVSDWVFRPARLHGSYAPSFVYVVLGFAAPTSMGAPAGTLQ